MSVPGDQARRLSLGVPIFMAHAFAVAAPAGRGARTVRRLRRAVSATCSSRRAAGCSSPDTHPGGNLQLGVGVKIPTGQNNATDTFRVLSGGAVTNQIRTVDRDDPAG